ncbi:hypothetical protein N7471_009882 [Penicillium samsonianum]|uniref:uncharacterized protein n=1 Tax=Penicillium samsonianum TaxID=1882272 RepID=UPI002548A548|nr:uncharacterized protein N7471_009882 [Penicillium samsonianum]KAJ6128665.1 hypothetical protein N7471_009882 [Penicillium samsonianum]
MALIKYPAQYYLPAAEIFWGLFTLGTAFVQSYQQLVVMRFFVGLSATSCHVGLVHVVNSWYKKQELGRRNALFWIANPIGQMFAGYLQAAAYTNLNNNHGLQGWRSVYHGMSSISMALYLLYMDQMAFHYLHDYHNPHRFDERTTSRFLKTEERALANKRLQDEGFKPSTGLDKTIIKRIFTSWRFYAFVLLLVIFCNMTYIAGALIMSFYSDIRGSRTEPIILSEILCIFANLVFSIWDIPDGLKFFAYISVGWSYGTIPVLIAWTAEGLAGDLEVRAITFASYNCLGEITSLVVPLVAWPVSKAPGFRGGFIWAMIISIFYLFNVAWIMIKQKRSNKRITMAEEQGSGEEDTVVANQLTIPGEVTKF